MVKNKTTVKNNNTKADTKESTEATKTDKKGIEAKDIKPKLLLIKAVEIAVSVKQLVYGIWHGYSFLLGCTWFTKLVTTRQN
jgi:hypothetical protein